MSDEGNDNRALPASRAALPPSGLSRQEASQAKPAAANAGAFTPGPWSDVFTEKAHASGRYWCEITGAGRVIGELYEDEEDIEGPLPIRANANLIAAAPDLYEALDDALGCLSEFGYGHGPTAAKIREVLAKARGEQ